jgi:hypothetical protein
MVLDYIKIIERGAREASYTYHGNLMRNQANYVMYINKGKSLTEVIQERFGMKRRAGERFGLMQNLLHCQQILCWSFP